MERVVVKMCSPHPSTSLFLYSFFSGEQLNESLIIGYLTTSTYGSFFSVSPSHIIY